MSEPETERTGFVIDDQVYEIPSLYSFDMDENKIMFDLSGTPTEDWLLMLETAKADDVSDDDVADITAKLKTPGLLRAFVHVAYRREHRDHDFAAIDVVVGKSSQIVNWAALFLAGKQEAEDENPPLAGTTAKADGSSVSEPAKPTNDSSNGTPGNGSSNSSEKPGETQPTIGTGGSGTSSPLSLATGSAD